MSYRCLGGKSVADQGSSVEGFRGATYFADSDILVNTKIFGNDDVVTWSCLVCDAQYHTPYGVQAIYE